jgi:hypothetical protein
MNLLIVGVKELDTSELPVVDAAIAQIGTWLQEFVPTSA